MMPAPCLFLAWLSALTVPERGVLLLVAAAGLGVCLGWVFAHVGSVPRRWPNERCDRN